MATTRLPDKPAAAGLTAPLSIVIVWVAGQYNIEVPSEVAIAFASLLASGAYYFVKEKEKVDVPPARRS